MKGKMRSLLMVVMVGVCQSMTGCYSNPEIPAGHEGYVVEKPRVWGDGGFQGAVTGPKNFGASIWNNVAINVDYRPFTYPEKFQIVTNNDLRVNITWQTIIRPKPGTVKLLVERYSGNEYYSKNIQKPLRSMVRKEIQAVDAMDIKSQQQQIMDKANASIDEFLKDMPFIRVSGVLGDIGFPQLVMDEIEKKIAAKERLKTKDTEILIAAKDAKVREADAKGIAKAQAIINATLSDQYLMHEAIMAQEKMAQSPNHTTVYIPVGAGGIPLVKTVAERQE